MVHLRSLYMKAAEKRKMKKAREAKYTPEAKYTVLTYDFVPSTIKSE